MEVVHEAARLETRDGETQTDAAADEVVFHEAAAPMAQELPRLAIVEETKLESGTHPTETAEHVALESNRGPDAAVDLHELTSCK